MIITPETLFKNGKCRFCQVVPNQPHKNNYHGIADMVGSAKFDIVFEDLKI